MINIESTLEVDWHSIALQVSPSACPLSCPTLGGTIHKENHMYRDSLELFNRLRSTAKIKRAMTIPAYRSRVGTCCSSLLIHIPQHLAQHGCSIKLSQWTSLRWQNFYGLWWSRKTSWRRGEETEGGAETEVGHKGVQWKRHHRS